MSYFGLDWLAMTLSFTAVWMLGNKRRNGFLLFAAANVTWLGVGVLAGSMGIFVGNLGFLIMNLRGFGRWSQESTLVEVATPAALKTAECGSGGTS